MLDVLERNYAGHIEDRRALALGICGDVMLCRTAGADKAGFARVQDAINTIAFTRKDTIGRSVSQCDTAATIHPFRDSKSARPINDSGRYAGFRINRAARFAGQPGSPECQSADPRGSTSAGECAGVEFPTGWTERANCW